MSGGGGSSYICQLRLFLHFFPQASDAEHSRRLDSGFNESQVLSGVKVCYIIQTVTSLLIRTHSDGAHTRYQLSRQKQGIFLIPLLHLAVSVFHPKDVDLGQDMIHETEIDMNTAIQRPKFIKQEGMKYDKCITVLNTW